MATSGDYSDLNNKPKFKTINSESILGDGNIEIIANVDDFLDETSENPVQNKAVTAEVGTIKGGSNKSIAALDAQDVALGQRVDSLEAAVGTGGSVDVRIQSAVSAEAATRQAKDEQLLTLYEALTQSDIIVVADHTEVSSPETNTIYREYGDTSYSDWMYYDGNWYKMATYNNAIDDEPTDGSNNLVKSGGVEGSLRPLFSNMIDLALTAIIPSGSRLVDINLNQAYQTAASTRTLIFVDRPELVQDVRFFRTDLSYVLTNITDYVTGNVLSENDEQWTMVRVVLFSNVSVDTPIRLNFCDEMKVSIPANYFKLKELPDINASITKLDKETKTLYNNNYCYVRKGSTAKLDVSGNTATLSAGDSNLVLVYQTNQIVALAAGESVSFTISRDGVLYYIVYSLTNNQFELKLYYQMRAENNEIIIGSLITSPESVDDAVFDYHGFYGIKVNDIMSYGNKMMSESANKTSLETSSLFNNQFCFARFGATATFTVEGTTATLSAGSSALVLVYQKNQIVALPSESSVTFSIDRGGILYYLVYNLSTSTFAMRLYHQMRAENNELVLGAIITSPAHYSDAIFDYYGLYGIQVNGAMSYGNSLTSKLAQSVNRAFYRLSLAKVIPVVKGNRLEIFRNSISTEVHDIYDLQIVPPASDGYGRFRSNGYIFDSGAEDNDFSLTFNLVDYMAQNTVSSVQTIIKPVLKKTSPASNKNILVVGDSYTYINTWLQELSRRLKGTGGVPTADGLTNLTFIGTVLHAASGTPVPCEGHSGQDYTYFVGSNSPFYYNGAVNIGSYASAHGYESIDMVLILLGCNGNNPISDVRTLIQSFVTYNPNIKIIVGSNAMKYNQWGWQNTGLRAGMKSSVWKDWYNWNSSVEKLIEDEFSENVFYIDIPAQIDIDNNFQFEEGDANNRNSQVQIRYGLNNVHPAESAYYQIADAFYNAFHYWCL